METTITPIPRQYLAAESARIHSWISGVVKRAFDVAASTLGLVLLLPIFAAIAYVIKRESPGPVFFRGTRAGRNGKDFKILKFRTMYERPESFKGAAVTAKDDSRITPLGHWLRNTKLNELPQLWNVLVGDMSLVGPRPEDSEIAHNWPPAARGEILSVRPGITSPASVLYHDEERLLSVQNVMGEYFKNILPDKLRLDRLYVRNRSFVADLDIIFWTLVILIPRIGRQRIPEGFLLAGPISRLARRHVSWFMIDLIVALASVGTVGLAWRALQPLNWGLQSLSVWAFMLALLFSGANALIGLNRIFWSRASAEDGMMLTLSNSLTTMFLLGLNRLLSLPLSQHLPPLPPEMIVVIGALAFLGSLIVRYRLRLITSIASRWLSTRGQGSSVGERVLIVGGGAGGQLASWLLQRGEMQQAFSVVGMVDDDPGKQGMRIGNCWVLGASGDIPALVKQHNVGMILFTIANISAEGRQQILKFSTVPGTRLIFMADILNSVQAHLTRPDPAGMDAGGHAVVGALRTQVTWK